MPHSRARFDLVAIRPDSYHRDPLILEHANGSFGPKNPAAGFRSKEAFLMRNPSTTLGQLAELVGGQLQGDSNLPIHGTEVLAEVTAGQITLVDHVDRLKQLNDTPAAAVVVAEKILSEFTASGNEA